jgi:predicted double-glycine peptidase
VGRLARAGAASLGALAAFFVAFLAVFAPPPLALVAGQEPVRLLPVPIISQATPWTCGGAALMAALVYFGVFDDAESQLDAALEADPEQGVAPEKIVAQARELGLDARLETGMTLTDLADELARGSLVIAAIQAWPAKPAVDPATEWEDGHYVVVVGLDAGRVYAMDPSVRTGYAYLSRPDFLRRWHDYDLRDGRRQAYEHLGIVLRGRPSMSHYPAEPTKIE